MIMPNFESVIQRIINNIMYLHLSSEDNSSVFFNAFLNDDNKNNKEE